jgi:hypothetical protein
MAMNPWCIGTAVAALGNDAASVAADAAETHAVDRTTLFQNYEVHELTTDSGIRIREFVNRGGIVFAVAWTAPVNPDLQRLLGTNYPLYANALAGMKERGLHRSLRVATPDLVVETDGHMRAVSGRAYLPASIPAGTTAADLR